MNTADKIEGVEKKIKQLQMVGIKLEIMDSEGANYIKEIEHDKTDIEIPVEIKKVSKGIRRLVLPDGVDYINRFLPLENFKLETLELDELVLPDSVKKIGRNCFLNCSIERIKMSKNLESLGAGAFRGCKGLKDFEFPSSLKKIGPNCFDGSSLCGEIKMPSSLEKLRDRAFRYCEITSANFNSCKIDKIPVEAFKQCRHLEKVNIPDSVSEIDSGAFYSCNSLKTIKMPKNLSYIANRSLGDSGITKVDFSRCENEVEFGGTTFYLCFDLERIVMPKKVRLESGEDGLVKSCPKLKVIDFSHTEEVHNIDGVIELVSRLADVEFKLSEYMRNKIGVKADTIKCTRGKSKKYVTFQ